MHTNFSGDRFGHIIPTNFGRKNNTGHKAYRLITVGKHLKGVHTIIIPSVFGHILIMTTPSVNELWFFSKNRNENQKHFIVQAHVYKEICVVVRSKHN